MITRNHLVSGLICLTLVVCGAGFAVGQSTGSIVGWGTQVVVEQSALEDLVGGAGGGFHSLGLRSDGTIVVWGDNEYGQCNVPSPNSDFVAIAAGYYHNVGVKSDGTIVAWGRNY